MARYWIWLGIAWGLATGPAQGQTFERPLIADNQQFLALNGTTDNKGLCRNTYQNSFKVKVAATGLLFPLSQTYSSWNDSEKQTDFANPATYRAAVSINKGSWRPLTWNGAMSKECRLNEIILNDPLEVAVKPGDMLYVRTEIRVPQGGKWGLGIQARSGDENPNWTEGGVNTAEEVLLSDKADFRPQAGLFTHSAHGVFGKPLEKLPFHPAAIVGDSISGYVQNTVGAIGNRVPVFNVCQPAESAERVWKAGQVRRKFFAGCDTLLFQDGVNDLRSRRSFEQLRSDATNLWEAFRLTGGKHLIVFTLTPLSRSTDKWATEAGQTPDFDPLERQKWNAYLRTVTDRVVKMKLTLIDTAALVESSSKAGVWKTLPSGSPATDDGVHPNAAGHAYLEKDLGPKIQVAVLQGSGE